MVALNFWSDIEAFEVLDIHSNVYEFIPWLLIVIDFKVLVSKLLARVR